MLTFKDIMTRSVVYYDERYIETCRDFAETRKISYMPLIDDPEKCYKYDLDAKRFEKKALWIKDPQSVEVTNDIFKWSLIEKFKDYEVLFVKNEKNLVGVVHFSDYNRQAVYREVYNQLYLLERGLKYYIATFSQEKTNIYEWLKYLKENSDLTRHKNITLNPKYQKRYSITLEDLHNSGASIHHILLFANQKELLDNGEDHIEKIRLLRNKIAHSELLIKVESKTDQSFRIEDFETLLDRIKSLRIVLRQVSNCIYLEKITQDRNPQQSVMPLDEFLFYYE